MCLFPFFLMEPKAMASIDFGSLAKPGGGNAHEELIAAEGEAAPSLVGQASLATTPSHL